MCSNIANIEGELLLKHMETMLTNQMQPDSFCSATFGQNSVSLVV